MLQNISLAKSHICRAKPRIISGPAARLVLCVLAAGAILSEHSSGHSLEHSREHYPWQVNLSKRDVFSPAPTFFFTKTDRVVRCIRLDRNVHFKLFFLLLAACSGSMTLACEVRRGKYTSVEFCVQDVVGTGCILRSCLSSSCTNNTFEINFMVF